MPSNVVVPQENIIRVTERLDEHQPSHSTGSMLVGVVAPYDLAMDRELWRWVPDDVSLLFTRTPHAPLQVTGDMARWVSRPEAVRRAAQDLSAVSPAAIVYACTTGSFVDGTTAERSLATELRRAGAPVAITASGALLAALASLHIGTLALATPYDAHLTGRLAAFLSEAGHRVDRYACLELYGGIWQVPQHVTADLVRQADSAEAEAVVVSCTNLATYDLIATLEAELAKPVITANQAMMWATMSALGTRPTGPGQSLLETVGVDAVTAEPGPVPA
jgi:maleate isomerase